jgi:hypothetical protein
LQVDDDVAASLSKTTVFSLLKSFLRLVSEKVIASDMLHAHRIAGREKGLTTLPPLDSEKMELFFHKVKPHTAFYFQGDESQLGIAESGMRSTNCHSYLPRPNWNYTLA